MTTSATAPARGRTRTLLPALLVMVGAAALVMMALHLRDGVVAKSDSAGYMSVADSLREGRGFTTPIGLPMHDMSPRAFVAAGDRLPLQGYPPLYAVLLAIGGGVGLDGRSAAGVLNAVTGTAMVVLLAYVTWVVAARSVAAVALVVAFVLVQDFFLFTLVRYLLPDGLLAALMLAQIVVTWRYLEDPVRMRFAAMVAVTAATVLTRQLGLALVASSMVGLLLLDRAPMSQRLRRAVAFAGLSLLPLAVYWVLSSSGAAGRDGFGQVAAHLPDRAEYQLAWDTTRAWMTGLRVPTWYTVVGGMIAVAAVVLACLGWRRSTTAADAKGADARRLGALLGLGALAYLGVLWFTRAFLDADVPLGERYLQPLLVLILPLLAGGLVRAATTPALARGLVAAALLVVGMRAWTTWAHAWDLPQSESVTSVGSYVATLPADAVVFAVDPEAIYNDTERSVYLLPTAINRYTGEPAAHLEGDLLELASLARERGVYVVYPLRTNREYVVSLPDLRSVASLQVVHEGAEDIVYLLGPLETP